MRGKKHLFDIVDEELNKKPSHDLEIDYQSEPISKTIQGTLYVPHRIRIFLQDEPHISPLKDFLVRTRSEIETKVGDENKLTVRAQVFDARNPKLNWTISGSALKNSKSFSMYEEGVKEITLSQDRAVDGRKRDPLDLSFSVKGEFGQLAYNSTRNILQSLHLPHYLERVAGMDITYEEILKRFPSVSKSELHGFSVIRQEYEDVRYGEVGTDPSNFDPYGGEGEAPEIPGKKAFSAFKNDPKQIPYTEDAGAEWEGESTFSSKDYRAHIHKEKVLEGFKSACTWATNQDRQHPLPTTENGACFGALGNYRAPAHNKIVVGGSGSSNHLYGRAVDLIGLREPWTYRFLKPEAIKEHTKNDKTDIRKANILALAMIFIENGGAVKGGSLNSSPKTYVHYGNPTNPEDRGNKVHVDWTED